ncbi:DUF4259 domain-containing protein [Streptomyces sp. NPDC003703]|uniref:DUF4259 domain-containing protein n=1 Tax=Streptomyces sp. NPDC003283 TaxID=3364681 RepID=UPI0036988427
MGTWDIGPFDNDTAADWTGALDDASADARRDLVLAALTRAADTTGFLDSEIGEEAVAAAALVAAQCPGGDPVDSAYGPRQPVPDLTGLRTPALRALDRVLTEESELLELWAESDSASWKAAMDRLRAALTPRPAADRPTPG